MALLKLLMQLRTPVGEQIALIISYLGTPFFILGFIAWYTLNKNKKNGYGICFSFFLSGLLCQGIKVIFRVPRPWILESNTDIFRPVSAALSSATGYSFPSIHSQGSAAFAEGIFYSSRKRSVRVVSILFLVLVGLSRMYLGCHTLKDVLTGIIIATVFSLFLLPIWNRSGKDQKNDSIFAFTVVGFSALLLFLVTALTSMETVEFELAKDGFETAGAAIGFIAAFLWDRSFIRYRSDGVGIKKKILRFLIGLAGFPVIEFGFKSLFGDNIPMLVLRYALIIFWIFGVTPFIAVRTGLAGRENV